jgi:hypothetical protein
MERSIKYLNKKEKITKFFSESENYFNKRIEFIKKLEKKKIKFKDAVKYSKIWINIKFKGCKYQKRVYLKVISFDK